MGLEKAILHGKEKRKPYIGSKSFDPHCRNNNWCPACYSNRQYFNMKALDKSKCSIKEYWQVSDE